MTDWPTGRLNTALIELVWFILSLSLYFSLCLLFPFFSQSAFVSVCVCVCVCVHASSCVHCASRGSMLFFSLLFILQSKEYPRNVPGNRARKFVDKEVCMIWTQPIQCNRSKETTWKYERKEKNYVVQQRAIVRSRSTNYSGLDSGNLQVFRMLNLRDRTFWITT